MSVVLPTSVLFVFLQEAGLRRKLSIKIYYNPAEPENRTPKPAFQLEPFSASFKSDWFILFRVMWFLEDRGKDVESSLAVCGLLWISPRILSAVAHYCNFPRNGHTSSSLQSQNRCTTAPHSAISCKNSLFVLMSIDGSWNLLVITTKQYSRKHKSALKTSKRGYELVLWRDRRTSARAKAGTSLLWPPPPAGWTNNPSNSHVERKEHDGSNELCPATLVPVASAD